MGIPGLRGQLYSLSLPHGGAALPDYESIIFAKRAASQERRDHFDTALILGPTLLATTDVTSTTKVVTNAERSC